MARVGAPKTPDFYFCSRRRYFFHQLRECEHRPRMASADVQNLKVRFFIFQRLKVRRDDVMNVHEIPQLMPVFKNGDRLSRERLRHKNPQSTGI